MRFNYKNNDYELAELKEPNERTTFDIIAIFRIDYCIWQGENLVSVDKKTYEESEDHFEKLIFVDYFYGVTDNDFLIKSAKNSIDFIESKKKEMKVIKLH